MASKRGLSPNLEAVIIAQLAPRMEEAAKAYADGLRENVSAGSRSGIQYASLPRRSSAPKEYPQSQSGELVDSVGTQKASNPLVYQAGFIGVPMAKALSLEFGSKNMEERAPLAKTADDPKTRAAMLTAAKRGR